MIGISIYPLVSSVEENIKYIEKAFNLGYRRVFTSILELDDNKEKALEQIDCFRTVLNIAKSLGMKVFVDINPEVLKNVGVNHQDFKFFSELGATGLRLDSVFNGFYESFITFNNQGLDIEVNGSFDTGYINSIVDLKCNKEKLFTCHNFYPEEFTGLSKEVFMSNHKRHKSLGLNTAAFVTANKGGSFGPWPANDGLCTLEEHRYLPIEVQAQELYGFGIDDVIIGNAFATDEELEALANLDKNIVTLRVEAKDLDEVEEGFFNKTLQNRWDSSSYVIRHFNGRRELKNTAIPSKTEGKTKYEEGAVLINNDNYANYKGELLVTLKELECDDRRNFVGYVAEEYKCLLKYIDGGKRFKLLKSE
ncbi:MAG: DUF871 domain-containing protein [Clostridium sp.]